MMSYADIEKMQKENEELKEKNAKLEEKMEYFDKLSTIYYLKNRDLERGRVILIVSVLMSFAFVGACFAYIRNVYGMAWVCLMLTVCFVAQLLFALVLDICSFFQAKRILKTASTKISI